MSKNITAIVGSNWGDEAKGLYTDYFCYRAKGKVLNVRYNGGAQAGHTVQVGDKRHIFQHFGAGTFANADTYLSRFFVCNPIAFNKELGELGLKDLPKVYISPSCYVTTPYEMLLNQIIEKSRGNSRHGSCGMGFHETIARNEKNIWSIHVSDLNTIAYMRQALDHIRNIYIPTIMEEMNIPMDPSTKDLLHSEEFMGRFLNEVYKFRFFTETFDTNILNRYEHIVFEGAQGLLLDQDYGTFPYVTHSNTGLKNIVALLEDAGLEDDPLNLVYVTRWYLTKHGVGPMPNEIGGLPHAKVVEKTNITNDWQGNFRYGWLDINYLNDRIYRDINNYITTKTPYTLNLAVSCLDQCNGEISYIRDNNLIKVYIKEFLFTLIKRMNLGTMYHSYGPTYHYIREN